MHDISGGLLLEASARHDRGRTQYGPDEALHTPACTTAATGSGTQNNTMHGHGNNAIYGQRTQLFLHNRARDTTLCGHPEARNT